jgi:ABC-2 type transport system permease protein
MKDVAHILYYKILIFLKVNSPFGFSAFVKSIGSGIVYLIFAYGCFVMTYNTIEYLLVTVKIGSFLLHRFILVVLFIFFVSINIGNMVVSFSTLYKSKEVIHLITKPISFTKLFLIKFLDNFFYSSTTLLLIISAVLLGYGFYFNLSFWFYPFALIILVLPFMFTAGSAGVIVLLVVLKMSGRWGLRKVLTIIGLVYSASVVSFYFISNPIKLVERVFDYYPNIDQYFGFLENGLVKLLPNYWISESLYWISQNKIERAIPYIYANLVSSIFVFGAALLIAKNWYYETWLTSLRVNAELRNKISNKNQFFGFQNKSLLNGFDESILKREFFLFFREPSQWLHLTVMIFLITIFISSISGIDIIILKAYNEYLKTIIYLIVSLFNTFLVASLSLRFVFPLISLEGETLWKIRSAPINFNDLLTKRLAIYFLLIFFIGQSISFFSNYQFPVMLSIIAQINAALTTITLVSLNFGMGGIFANYKEKNAIRLASSQGASITFLFTLLYLVLIIAILFIPVSNYFYAQTYGINISVWGLLITSMILFIIMIFVSTISIKLGLKSFTKDY